MKFRKKTQDSYFHRTKSTESSFLKFNKSLPVSNLNSTRIKFSERDGGFLTSRTTATAIPKQKNKTPHLRIKTAEFF